MKYARRQRRIDARSAEHLDEVFHCAGAPGSYQGYLTAFAHRSQLRNIIAAAHTVARHAIEHNLSGAALLHFYRPLECAPRSIQGSCRIAGELLHAVFAVDGLAVDAYN